MGRCPFAASSNSFELTHPPRHGRGGLRPVALGRLVFARASRLGAALTISARLSARRRAPRRQTGPRVEECRSRPSDLPVVGHALFSQDPVVYGGAGLVLGVVPFLAAPPRRACVGGSAKPRLRPRARPAGAAHARLCGDLRRGSARGLPQGALSVAGLNTRSGRPQPIDPPVAAGSRWRRRPSPRVRPNVVALRRPRSSSSGAATVTPKLHAPGGQVPLPPSCRRAPPTSPRSWPLVIPRLCSPPGTAAVGAYRNR